MQQDVEISAVTSASSTVSRSARWPATPVVPKMPGVLSSQTMLGATVWLPNVSYDFAVRDPSEHDTARSPYILLDARYTA